MTALLFMCLAGCNAQTNIKSRKAEDSQTETQKTKIEEADKTAEKKQTDTAKNTDNTITKNGTDKTEDIKDPVQTSSAKNQKKVIVIDPGHANCSNLTKEPLSPGSSVMKIKDGGGAQGIVTKTPEYEVNMKVALKLKTLLEQKDYSVIMTKTDNSLSLGNVERAEIGNKANASLVIRIHADSCDNTSAKGASMLVPAAINDNTETICEPSKKYGTIVLNTLVKEVGMKNRGVIVRNDMTGFNWSKVPVILVEMGFLSNPDEDKLLSSDEYQDKLAAALADGIKAAIK